jgi:hypothetical protein
LQDPISETKQNKTFTEKGWWSGSRCRPWIQTPVLKKKSILSFCYMLNFVLRKWRKKYFYGKNEETREDYLGVTLASSDFKKGPSLT